MYAFANAYKQEGSSQGQTKKPCMHLQMHTRQIITPLSFSHLCYLDTVCRKQDTWYKSSMCLDILFSHWISWISCKLCTMALQGLLILIWLHQPWKFLNAPLSGNLEEAQGCVPMWNCFKIIDISSFERIPSSSKILMYSNLQKKPDFWETDIFGAHFFTIDDTYFFIQMSRSVYLLYKSWKKNDPVFWVSITWRMPHADSLSQQRNHAVTINKQERTPVNIQIPCAWAEM